MIVNYLKDLSNKTNELITLSDDDIIKEGLHYCKTCGEPLQARYQSKIRGEIIQRVPCKCIRAVWEHEEQVKAAAAREIKIDELRRRGFQDKKLLSYSFELDDSPNCKQSQILRKYVANWKTVKKNNLGLLLLGGVGTGKSFYAGCVGNAVIEQYVEPVIITSVSRIKNTLFSATDKQRIISDLTAAELLILDDLGAEHSTDYSLEILFSVVDERYKANKPVVVTSNLTIEDFNNPSDIRFKRVFDRLIELCTPIIFEGHSRRQEVAAKKSRKLLEVLS